MADWEGESDDQSGFLYTPTNTTMQWTKMLVDYIGNSFIGRIVCIMLIAASSACGKPAVDELTFTRPYANFIGAEYRLVGEVNAHGIYEDLNHRVAPSYIVLIPGVGIGGPEVAFKRPIAKGQTIKILSAWRAHALLYSRVYYVVTSPDTDLPHDVPVRIDLSRGNEGVDAELNPGIYERLAK